ncbi:MAG: DUF3800 domain-containing protein [Bacilli bacterium]|nr:DUF3800 domain-containing protein [Bacilli bacterium]
MKVFIYLDESGSIHKNSKSPFFAVGGYLVSEKDRLKIISTYKRINLLMKKNRNLLLSCEIKATDMLESEKIDIIESVQKIKSFYSVGKVFNKKKMKKEIYETNIFFNYAIKVLFNDVIIPKFKRFKKLEFIISIDNRNIRVGELNNLENYLKTEFCFYDYDFSVTYYDSKTNFGIQLADLLVNTFYNYYKDVKLIKNLVLILDDNKYNVSMFPLTKTKGNYYN